MISDKRPMIMLVENDRTVLELMELRLELGGFHTCTARYASAIHELLREHHPAAMIIDLRLPDAPAFEMLRELSLGGRLPMPTLLTVRAPSADEVRTAMSLGVKDVLLKPFSGADVVDRVYRLLRPNGGVLRDVA
jgi:two-component system catabolic regulation response regulator CreB